MLHSCTVNSRNKKDWIVIEGAGSPVVNGVYKPDGFHGRAHRYVRSGPQYCLKGKRRQLYIFRCPLGIGGTTWYISLSSDDNKFGTTADVDFYYATEKGNVVLPPPTGWRFTARMSSTPLQGRNPAPTLIYVDPEKEKLKRAKIYWSRIANEVTCPRWELKLHQVITEYIQNQDRSFDETSSIDKSFQKYVHTECLTMLELALWKAATIVKVQPESLKGYHEFMHWINKGWKAKKKDTRKLNSICIVMECILPFIETPWDDSAPMEMDGLDATVEEWVEESE